MSFSFGNERLNPFGKNLPKQLNATRHMRQTQIGDVLRGRYGIVELTKINFVAIEIWQSRPMWTRATRFDNATRPHIFCHPQLCLQPRIIVETLANQITAKAVVKQNWQEERKSPLSPFERLQRRANHQNQEGNCGQNITRFRSRERPYFQNVEEEYGAAQGKSARCRIAEIASSQD